MPDEFDPVQKLMAFAKNQNRKAATITDSGQPLAPSSLKGPSYEGGGRRLDGMTSDRHAVKTFIIARFLTP